MVLETVLILVRVMVLLPAGTVVLEEMPIVAV